MNPNRLDTESQQAERLERYLSGLEEGKVLQDNPTSPAEQELFRFARECKTVAQPIHPSTALLESIRPTAKRRTWTWLLPLPIVGTAIATVFFFLQSQKPLTNTTATFDLLLTEEVTRLDQLDSDLAVATDQLEGQISAIDFYAADEGIEQL